MLVTQIVILGTILLVIPAVVGTVFVRMDSKQSGALWAWISGQMLLWAGFLVLSVPLILLQKSFTMVVNLYGLYMVLLMAIAIVIALFRKLIKKENIICGAKERGVLSKSSLITWIAFGVLLLLQMVLSVCLAYEEGDDAFYIAISTVTESSDTMYQTLPYTGLTTGLDARHGLAPFPIWIAFLARVSGMPAVSVAQIVLPVAVVLMTYAVYYLLARYLFAGQKKNIPFFMLLIALMFMFGGYSVYSAENFLLVRASQGKAVIANVIIPFLLYLLFVRMERLKRKERCGLLYWLLLAAVMAAGCLCSTLGTLLTCMVIGVIGLCTAVVYRRWTVLIPLGLCCAAPVMLALLYFGLR